MVASDWFCAERTRAADRACARLLDHLADAGPSSVDDLRAELGLTRQALKSLRAQLERCGAIVSRSLEVTAGHRHPHQVVEVSAGQDVGGRHVVGAERDPDTATSAG